MVDTKSLDILFAPSEWSKRYSTPKEVLHQHIAFATAGKGLLHSFFSISDQFSFHFFVFFHRRSFCAALSEIFPSILFALYIPPTAYCIFDFNPKWQQTSTDMANGNNKTLLNRNVSNQIKPSIASRIHLKLRITTTEEILMQQKYTKKYNTIRRNKQNQLNRKKTHASIFGRVENVAIAVKEKRK